MICLWFNHHLKRKYVINLIFVLWFNDIQNIIQDSNLKFLFYEQGLTKILDEPCAYNIRAFVCVETLCSREIQLRFDVAKNYNVMRIFRKFDFLQWKNFGKCVTNKMTWKCLKQSSLFSNTMYYQTIYLIFVFWEKNV